MSKKKNEYDEFEEQSLKILKYIETLVEKNDDGFVKAGNVMGLLGGTIHMFFKQTKEQLGEKRAAEIKSALMLLVSVAGNIVEVNNDTTNQ